MAWNRGNCEEARRATLTRGAAICLRPSRRAARNDIAIACAGEGQKQRRRFAGDTRVSMYAASSPEFGPKIATHPLTTETGRSHRIPCACHWTAAGLQRRHSNTCSYAACVMRHPGPINDYMDGLRDRLSPWQVWLTRMGVILMTRRTMQDKTLLYINPSLPSTL